MTMENSVDKTNVITYMMDYEMGNLSPDNIIKLFQYLLDSGMSWKLQGTYGRMTKMLLDSGYLIKR
jgi:hypothetical protein